MRSSLLVPMLLASTLLAAALPRGVSSAELAIETSIFGTADKPQSVNRTLFHAGRVYDIQLSGSGDGSILDPQQQTIELLSPSRQVRTTIHFTSLTKFVAALQLHALQANPLIRFAASPDFELVESSDATQLKLRSDWMEYEVQAEKVSAELAEVYHEFADWYARLNATVPGALPPGARLELNRQLAERQWIPTRIELTVRNEEKSTQLRSEHTIARQLSSEDLRRIEKLEDYRQRFRSVDLTEFRR